jgi:uncharacterized membrane protein
MTSEKQFFSLEELRQMRKPLRNVNTAHQEKLTPAQKLALSVTIRVGSMSFFSVIFIWTALWLGWNTVGPIEFRFDPYPAFVLWLFISNMLQLLFLPLIMAGQNLQRRHAESLAETDCEVNVRAEREIETSLLHLERQNELILKILRHLEGR